MNNIVKSDSDVFIRDVFSISAPYIDLLSSAFSFGIADLWRRKLIALSGIKRGDRVLDVCTGTGKLISMISHKVEEHGSVTAIDFCPDVLEIAQKRVNLHPVHISFVLANAKSLPFPDSSFDSVTVAFGMRNIPETIPALREIRRVLKPGGGFCCLELTRPRKKWFLTVYKFYIFRIMPFLAKLIMNSAVPYNYLPMSIFTFYSPGEFCRVIEESGFEAVHVRTLTCGAATIFTSVKDG
jgi:demethylmenaquinone methyltransferase/2-methoxy-6-polyprenyl-1,4-benzoquinol methylase